MPEADVAFEDLKRYRMSPHVMVAARPREPLVLYLAATPHSASAALMAVREEHADTSPTYLLFFIVPCYYIICFGC